MLESLFLRPPVAPSWWAENSGLVLPRDTSPNDPGMLTLKKQPFLREILDCAADPSVETVFFSGGSQLGKSVLLLCMFGYMLEVNPCNGLWVMTSIPQMKEFSDKRLMPFIRANDCLARHVKPDNPGAFRSLSYELDCMNVKLVGAGSPAGLSSEPAGWVVGDEASKWEWLKKSEAPPLKLAMERTKAFPRRFHVFCSTPTTVDSEFWQGFVSGDMRQFFVPCPHCEGEFVFEFKRENMRWDKPDNGVTDIDLAEATTRYLCPHCAAEIWHEEKFAMMERGCWKPSSDLRREFADEKIAPSSSTRSYQLSSMYSPYLSWGKYTRAFLEGKQRLDRAQELQNLTNSWGGLPFEFTAVTVKNEHIAALCGKHDRGRIPEGFEVYYVAVQYDPGGSETHWAATAVGPRGKTVLLDWGTILRYKTETEQVNTGTEDKPLWETRVVPGKEGIAVHYQSLEYDGVKPTIGLIDSGYSTGDIYEECMLLPGELTPTRGSKTSVGLFRLRPAGDTWPGLQVLMYSDFYAKKSLYSETIAHGRAPELVLPREQDCDADLVRGLSGQKLVKKGYNYHWRDVPDDHFGDCIKIGRVGWWCLAERFEDIAVLPEQDAGDARAEGH